jgi:hypothetical protein
LFYVERFARRESGAVRPRLYELVGAGRANSQAYLEATQLSLTRRTRPIRNHIQGVDTKHWAKHWDVSPEQIRAAIDKVGNSVEAVQKELGRCGLVDAIRFAGNAPNELTRASAEQHG